MHTQRLLAVLVTRSLLLRGHFLHQGEALECTCFSEKSLTQHNTTTGVTSQHFCHILKGRRLHTGKNTRRGDRGGPP